MKFLVTIIFTLSTLYSFAQNKNKQNDSLKLQSINAVSYRLFPTQNIYNFIKLNTRNGQMWLVQFGVEEENRMTTNLSIVPLVTSDKEVNDRFTLYPTQNIYTFILLDQMDGRTWQVHWSINLEKRFITPIE
ncbi:MAG: hypothetical protein PSX81_04240 [bacterium]|nr:hypothetical protein [bacterium]